MHAATPPLGSVYQRTRGQLANFFRNWNNEVKKKRSRESVGNGGRDDGVTISENTGGVGDIEDSFSLNPNNYEVSGKRAKRKGKRKLDKDDEPIVSENIVSDVSCSESGSESIPNEGSIARKRCKFPNVDEDNSVEHLSSSGDDTPEVGDGTDTVKSRKEENHEFILGGLKKKKFSGLQNLVNCKNECDKEQDGIAKRLRPRLISRSRKEKLELGKFSQPLPVSDGEESNSSLDVESKSSTKKGSCYTKRLQRTGQNGRRKVGTFSKKKTRAARNADAIKTFFVLIEKEADGARENLAPVDNNLKSLPLKFRFVGEEPSPPEKSEWEKEIDSLFCDLNMGLRESEPACTNPSMIGDDDDIVPQDIDSTLSACCCRGEHDPILDEQIGIKCKYCSTVILEIEDILPPFYTPPSGRHDRKYFGESHTCIFNQIQFQDSACGNPSFSSIHPGDTVWDLIRDTKSKLYPHQREGFEFMWRNIAGDIFIEKLRRPLSEDGKGCIISHAPGTGKTRLTIVFLQAFMKLYPICRPVILAPRGMLLTWEEEFRKWDVKIPFHNLNTTDLSAEENAISAKIIGQVGCHGRNRDFIRLVKLYSWVKGRSILGVSYTLFEKLAGEHREKGQRDQIRNILLKSPGLLVLDEGHTPRNDQSLMWKALMKVVTNRRIILSGTPFQNNFEELYNTLYLVNPKFADQITGIHQSCKRGRPKKNVARGKWTTLTKSIRKTTDDGLMKLRTMIDPFVHVHKGTILQESLPGIRDSLIFLRPTELQKSLLEIASEEQKFLHMVRVVSLISVHPSLVAEEKMFSAHKRKLKGIESKIDAGVKTKFVTKLIWLADALGERVLIFSQFIDNLVFIKHQLQSHFSWKEGREVLYMDGKLDQNQRQSSINSFNDDSSEAKVLLASERACSEGINLVGASRVILLDSVWNPSVERQAISRAYRLGQKKAVYVYHLITSETMELKKYASQARKDRTSQLIFSATDGLTCHSETSKIVTEDKLFETLVDDKSFSHIFEKIIHQPTASDLIDTFGFADLEW
ncbi:SNF2 domain-containing protein CLASSY 3 [Abeliophyllum distichum]|uniref:SNF2 domain-containing protein CLASSY 3 n=1 Tax=Abeliophyllum distichum TaxID=126358 RepID=A0ABD1PB72_9LAMI